MRKFGTLVATAAVAVVGFMANEASAAMTMVAVGPPVPSNSWIQTIQIQGAGSATSITLQISQVSNAFGSIFEFLNNTVDSFDVDPVTAGLQAGGWAAAASTNASNDINGVPGYLTVVLSGSATSSLTFNVHLTSPVGTGVFITGSANSGTTATFTVLSTIPLPAAAWAGMAMLAGMGLVAAKRRRNRVVLD